MSAPPVDPGRRRNMQGNRRKDTTPELKLRSELHRAGYRYRVDFRIDLDGARVRPDIVFTKRHVAVFIDGCFWHSCPEHGREPTTNTGYWGPKLARNRERDRSNTMALQRAGWTVVRIWEHQPVDEALAAVQVALASSLEASE